LGGRGRGRGREWKLVGIETIHILQTTGIEFVYIIAWFYWVWIFVGDR
jgi:hypothetical protein